ncbi:hypothetical protein D3C71_1549980 [compost metagenome]|jgi:hypothetical protein
MTARLPIAEALISCRNILVDGRSTEHVLPSLEAVLQDLDLITVPSTKNIVSRCVTEAINQVKSSDFFSAGMILNLIHNLPLNEERLQRWDIDYFLSMELSGFLDRFDEIKNARQVVLYVCGQVAGQHVPSDG